MWYGCVSKRFTISQHTHKTRLLGYSLPKTLVSKSQNPYVRQKFSIRRRRRLPSGFVCPDGRSRIISKSMPFSPSGRDSVTLGERVDERVIFQTSPSDYLTAQTSRLTSNELSGAFELRAPEGNIWRVRTTTEKRRPLVFRANFVVFYCRA